MEIKKKGIRIMNIFEEMWEWTKELLTDGAPWILLILLILICLAVIV